MTDKIDIQKRVLQNGKPLDLDKFEWDEKTKTFSTLESNLVLDFTGINSINFITNSYCTFKTNSYCTFKTGSYCTFKTGYYCTFDTGSDCTFDTCYYCTFDTCSNCTFNTGSDCTFNTGSDCGCIRRDVFEFFEILEGKKIKLNGYEVKGYTFLEEKKEIIIDGKTIEISAESFEELKTFFNNLN